MEVSEVRQTHRLRYLIAGCLLAVSLGLLVTTSQAYAATGPAVIATDFPDANFQAALSDPYYDANGDGTLDQAELDAVTVMFIQNKGIASLVGIEYFTNLEELWVSDNNLSSLDLRDNTKLTGLNADDNKLVSVDLRNNTKLQRVLLARNEITSLTIDGLTALYDLKLTENKLTSIDVSTNIALSYLQADTNQITAIDVSKNTALVGLNLIDNQLTSLDVSKNIALIDLDLSSNTLTAIDVGANPLLSHLNLGDNNLASIDVSTNTNLNYLYLGYNSLTSIDVSANINLIDLDVTSNNLEELDVTGLTALTYLLAGDNALLDLKGFTGASYRFEGSEQRILISVEPDGSGGYTSGSFLSAFEPGHVFNFPPASGVSYDATTGVFTTNILYDENDLVGTTFPFTTTFTINGVDYVVSGIIGFELTSPTNPAPYDTSALPATGDTSALPLALAALAVSCGTVLLRRRRFVR